VVGKTEKSKRQIGMDSTPLNRVLRVKGAIKEVRSRFMSLRDNMKKIVKLRRAIIKLQSELERAYNKKKSLEWASELK
jgi:predicted  nucleic acid-binding Zn-ribbon protein